jgi:hypothetical protein
MKIPILLIVRVLLQGIRKEKDLGCITTNHLTWDQQSSLWCAKSTKCLDSYVAVRHAPCWPIRKCEVFCTSPWWSANSITLPKSGLQHSLHWRSKLKMFKEGQRGEYWSNEKVNSRTREDWWPWSYCHYVTKKNMWFPFTRQCTGIFFTFFTFGTFFKNHS